MDRVELLEFVRGLDGAFVLTHDEHSGAPEIAWGDSFCYYAPDGTVPQNVQPFATVVTKYDPCDAGSILDPPRLWRVNIHVDLEAFRELVGDTAPDGSGRDLAES